MANNDVILRRPGAGGGRGDRRSAAGAEGKFVWVAIEALPSADAVQVLRGDSEPDLWRRDDDGGIRASGDADATSATSADVIVGNGGGGDDGEDEDHDPTYACPKPRAEPAAVTATVTAAEQTKEPPEQETEAAVSPVTSVPVESRELQDMEACAAETSGDGGGDGGGGDDARSGERLGGGGGDGGEVEAAPPEADPPAPPAPPPPPPSPPLCLEVTPAPPAPPAPCAFLSLRHPGLDVLSSGPTSEDEECDEVGPLITCAGGDKPAEDRYSNYFEERLALLDSAGPDSLDGFRITPSREPDPDPELETEPETEPELEPQTAPEPEYAVPHSGSTPTHVTPTEVRSGAAIFPLPPSQRPPPSPPPSPPPPPLPPPLPPTSNSPEPPPKLSLDVERHPIYEDIEPSPDERIRSLGEEIYDAITDAVRPVSGTWDDHTIYEDVDEVGGCSGDAALRRDARRELSSDSSWSEEFESMSEPDDEPRPPIENFGAIKHLLRRKRPVQNAQKPKPLQKNGRAASVEPVERKSSLEKRAPMTRRDSEDGEGRLSRWFSLRKSSHYDISDRARSLGKMTSVTEDATAAELLLHRRHQPPALPAAPAGLSSEQLKRRHIVQSIVSSENNYVASLQSLVNDYKKAMEEANPPLLNPTKISVIFKRVTDILQCHTLFRIALTDAVKRWDEDEKIGDVFVASFSKANVLDDYSEFINNFSVSMETIKHEAKRKSTFADFLKMRQISSPDRLSLFGLMVKPVQRFPQFILLLQDLLKHTPHGHHDRMSLQLALTQLESLAEMLNERKRESEQFKAFRETLRRLNGKFSMRSLADTNRYLLREDNATRLEFGTNGTITKSKNRRLFLLNDLVVCVSVAGKSAEDASAPDRLTLKWSVPVTDVEIQEASTSLTLSHVITATAARPTAGARTAEDASSTTGGPGDLSNVGQLCHKMGNLMHDYEVVSRIGALVETLKGEYPGLNTTLTSQIAASIQRSIRQKDEEIAWLDACCLQLAVKKAGKEEHFTFQLESPAKKREWTTDFRLAQLALDGNNSPAWDVPESEHRAITRVPLFVKTMPVVTPAAAVDDTEVQCGCFYSVTIVKPTQRTRQQSYLWICTSDGVNSFVMIYAMQQVGFRDVLRFELPGERVTAMEYVSGEMTETGCRSGTVWISTASSRLLQYSAQEPEHCHQLASTALPAPARRLVPHGDAVFAALESGSVATVERAADGGWLSGEPGLLRLGARPVTCLLPIGGAVYAGCGRQVSVIDAETRDVVKSFTVQEHESSGDVHLLAHSGIGLWISLAHSSTICLYHTETFRHLQDINVASNISRVMGDSVRPAVAVTALLAGRGLLWVGTNVGVTLTIPLPRLEGVPIVSGRGNISHHAHCGPVTYLQVLSAPAPRPPPAAAQRESVILEESAPVDTAGRLLEKRRSDTSLSETKKSSVRLPTRFSSPSLLRKRSRDRDNMTRRLSKTLPRGMGLLSANGAVLDDVYGLYGNLLNLPGFDESRELGDIDAQLRRSDPELLAGLPSRMASLDRRLQVRSVRPRSLDLSSWSVDSRSSAQTTSSSSEGDRAHSAPASRVASFRTDTATPSDSRSAGSGAGDGRAAKEEPARSVLTVTAGRGYVNLSRAERKNSASSSSSVRLPTSRDAHLVLWEMKL